MEENPIPSTPVAEIEGELNIGRPRYNHEFRLARELRSRRVGFFLPMQREERYWGGRRRFVWRRVMPGLIFIGNGAEGRDAADENHRMRGYSPVHVAYQKQLKAELAKVEKKLVEQQPYPKLQVGTTVCVTGGPFIYKEGWIEHRGKANRFTVRLELFGDSPSVEIDASLLEPV